MPNRKDADVVGSWRGQYNFRNQVGPQQFSPEENERRSDDEPRCGDPLHRVNHLVIEGKVVDQQHGNPGARIENERRPARPAVDTDLIDAKDEKIRAEQALWSWFDLALCAHSSGKGIIVRPDLRVHEGILILLCSARGRGLNPRSAGAVLECAAS